MTRRKAATAQCLIPSNALQDTIIHEAHVMSSLRHPNVLGLLACFVEVRFLHTGLPFPAYIQS